MNVAVKQPLLFAATFFYASHC